jgi:hypothetical protein
MYGCYLRHSDKLVTKTALMRTTKRDMEKVTAHYTCPFLRRLKEHQR